MHSLGLRRTVHGEAPTLGLVGDGETTVWPFEDAHAAARALHGRGRDADFDRCLVQWDRKILRHDSFV